MTMGITIMLEVIVMKMTMVIMVDLMEVIVMKTVVMMILTCPGKV